MLRGFFGRARFYRWLGSRAALFCIVTFRSEQMKNQQAALVLIAILAIGCASDSTSRDRVDARHEHPPVRMTGIDGTVFRGDLLNGPVTIDSGLGQLTLLTD